MEASDLNFEALRPTDLNDETLNPGSKAAPFSTFLYAVASGDIATAEAQIADDIEWGLMPYNKVLKGKDEVIPWLQTGSSDQKEPVAITNVDARDWGIFEYWNIGVKRRSDQIQQRTKMALAERPEEFLGPENTRLPNASSIKYQSGRKD